MDKFTNPILKGFYPDPSICRVEEDYYLVTSSFTYFPGVPIFHSRDMVNWKQIGHVLDRESQLPLTKGHHSTGIFAPTIRYYDGVFYMITTNVSNGGNFVVKATNPEGPWSEPYWLDAKGIDPSLFFDEDGRCYYTGARDRSIDPMYEGDNEIFIQEFDYHQMTLVGESKPIWFGADKLAIWAEGPHIYAKDGWYYLLISEGGTGHEHALTIARSKVIDDLYVGNICNPILTHRHLGRAFPISNVGHGDLVETQNGEWWLVHLGSRPYGGYYRNLGRETFMAPVVWEDGWPLVNPGVGYVEFQSRRPDLPLGEPVIVDEIEDFKDLVLPHHFIYSRNPEVSNYSLEDRHDYLRLYLSSNKLNENKSPSFVGRRQQDKSFIAETKIHFSPTESSRAGVCLIQSNEFNYSMYLTMISGVVFIEVSRHVNGVEEILASVEVTDYTQDKEYVLYVYANEQELNFSYKSIDQTKFTQVISKADGRILSTDIAGGFVGTIVGMFATSMGSDCHSFADFDYFKLVNCDKE